jgi:hypothetical protein
VHRRWRPPTGRVDIAGRLAGNQASIHRHCTIVGDRGGIRKQPTVPVTQLRRQFTQFMLVDGRNYVFPSADADAPQDASERPMTLAGANLGLAGKTGPDGQDGILYALEAMDLNLEGTELATLSACDTGQGKLAARRESMDWCAHCRSPAPRMY